MSSPTWTLWYHGDRMIITHPHEGILHWSSFFLIFFFFFNLNIYFKILQCYTVFCYIAILISHNYTYVPSLSSLLSLPPLILPGHHTAPVIFSYFENYYYNQNNDIHYFNVFGYKIGSMKRNSPWHCSITCSLCL